MNVAEINPLSLPSLPLAERHSLPNCPAIYFVMRGEHALYIGKTVNLAQRWTQHHKWQQFSEIPAFLRITWLECSDISLLHGIETALISHFDPIFNRGKFQHLSSKKLNAVIPDETWEALDEIASREMRTKSQMAAILLGEAIAEYRKRHSLKNTEADLADSTDHTQDSPTGNTTPPATKAKRGKGSKSAS
jgi:Nuclease subunit of the excinuclease complex